LLAVLHARFAFGLIVLTVLLGLWGTYQYLRRRAVSGGFRSTFLVLAGLTAAQGLAGLVVLAIAGPPRYLLHVVYGVFAVVFLPAVYAYAGRGARDREAVFLAAACWIVLIAFIRGWTTGYSK
jgi:CDP-diglyceride synthetase